MIINSNSSTIFSSIWLPVFFYVEPLDQQVIISILELMIYLVCIHLVNVSLHVALKIRLFHRNLYILALPMFGMWYELIIGKFITIAYRLKLLGLDFELGEHTAIWTNDPGKVLLVASLNGLELLIFGGFLQWHYMYSWIFGVLTVAVERVIASVLIENYESNTQNLMPAILLIISQFLSISMAFGLLFQKVGPLSAHFPWMISCPISVAAYVFVKKVNESFRREIKNPGRKRIFTLSQQFQVKENLRVLHLGTRLVFAVLSFIGICGCGIAALHYKIVPSYYCHLIENVLFLNPFLIGLTAMLSIPQWKEQFMKSFLTVRLFRNRRKPVHIVVEIEECAKKKNDVETNLYFKQLANSWI
ncbi:Serpentine receptor class epsilon-33 [Caenorhabditis elegans]|uniref:Serpentine receptor class epsilon-33 n=1 Tax=Caenorhabditis elegans TaxID=6239 RepID=SRE33_CAEEL|nr:Serpentine receptor class epsilon-33 [Caenorhabditis elegans]O18175.2 RecName: Full=Serpentine receptor class epsilon-33; Short=Protein sre-33 [Caenorhabditis elegans]CAB03481.2 Serpentine receptor class epsilon-33 [Caenorhabditis elegans]|eukprot:NP_496649.2 Serpentine receptor class epsilon-33 [Caenorhabditis elegans]